MTFRRLNLSRNGFWEKCEIYLSDNGLARNSCSFNFSNSTLMKRLQWIFHFNKHLLSNYVCRKICCLPWRQKDIWRSFQCPQSLTIHWGSVSDEMRLHDRMESVQVLERKNWVWVIAQGSKHILRLMCVTEKVILGLSTELWHCNLQACHLSFPVKGNWNTNREPAQKPQSVSKSWIFIVYLPPTCSL